MPPIGYLPRPATAAAVLAMLLVALAGCAEPPSDPPAPAPWAWALPECVGYRPADYPAAAHRVSATVHRGALVTEQEEVYEPGWGPRAMADIRAAIRACASHEYQGSEEIEAYLEQLRVVGTGFAGDESLLVETVRLVPPRTHTWYAAVVRYGDRVITLRARGLGLDATRCLVRESPATCPAARA